MKYSLTGFSTLLVIGSAVWTTVDASQHFTSTYRTVKPFLSAAYELQISRDQSVMNQSIRCQNTRTSHCMTIQSSRDPDSQVSGDYVLDPGRGGSDNGHAGPIDKYANEQPKNLRVIFLLDTMENSPISGGGIPTGVEGFEAGIWANWHGSSSAATIERYMDQPGETGVVGLPLPEPGDLWELDHANVLYDALVLDGCGNVPVFPINWNSGIVDVDNLNSLLGEFTAYDDSTLTPTGYWNFRV